MTNIAELYAQLQIPNNNIISQATEAILQFYQNADSIFPIIEVLKTHPQPIIRKQAAIGLKSILQNFWYGYSTTPSAESIVNEIISLLKNESEIVIRHLIIHAVDPICSHREFVWARLIDDFAFSCIQSNEPGIIDIGLSLYKLIIQYLDEETISNILMDLTGRLNFLLQTPSDLIPAASNVVSSLVQLFQPNIPQSVKELIELLFQVFRGFLLTDCPFINLIANDLLDIISVEGKTSFSRHLSFLLEIAYSNAVPPAILVHVFTPISAINVRYNEPNIRFPIQALFTTVFNCISACFVDDCLSEQSDAFYIFNVLDGFLDFDDREASEIYSYLSGSISNSGTQVTFSSLLIIQFFIDKYSHVIADNLSHITSFLLEQSNVSNHHCLCEQSLVCIYHFIDVINGGLTQYSNDILRVIINAVSVDHDPIILCALDALACFFKTFDFDHGILESILNLLFSIIKRSPEIMKAAIFAISTVISASGPDIAPFVGLIAPAFIELSNMNELFYPQIKVYLSESLARMLMDAPNQTVPFAEPIMQLLVHQCSNDDLFELDSVLSAFTILIKSQIPNILEALQIALEKAFQILRLECPLLNDGMENQDESEISLPQEYEAKQAAMHFIGLFVLDHPDLFAPHVQPFIDLLFSHINDCFEPSTRILAIKTFATLAKARLKEPSFIISSIFEMDLFNEDNPSIVSCCFSSIKKILNSEVPPELANECIKIALKGFARRGKRLLCQESDDIDNYVIESSILKFLSRVAQTHPPIFPLNKVLRIYIGRLKNDPNKNFISLCINSIVNYLVAVKNSGANFGEIIPADIFKLILNYVAGSLGICDGTVIPYPLNAAKELFKAGLIDLSSPFLTQTLAAINNIMAMQYAGQPTYQLTIAAVVSLLFVIFVLSGENFDVGTYLNFMISSLPITFKHYSNDAYTSLILLINKFAPAFAPLMPQLIIGLSKTLITANKTLYSAGLTDQIIVQLVNILKNLLMNVPNTNQIISENLNQNEQALLHQRLSS